MNIIDEISNRLTKPYIIDPDSKRILERCERIFRLIEQTDKERMARSSSLSEAISMMENTI